MFAAVIPHYSGGHCAILVLGLGFVGMKRDHITLGEPGPWEVRSCSSERNHRRLEGQEWMHGLLLHTECWSFLFYFIPEP